MPMHAKVSRALSVWPRTRRAGNIAGVADPGGGSGLQKATAGECMSHDRDLLPVKETADYFGVAC